jgi:hypothetical protein
MTSTSNAPEKYYIKASDSPGLEWFSSRSAATKAARAINRINPGLPKVFVFAQGGDRSMTDFQAIAADLDLCDTGLALTKGAIRRKYATHRKACFAAIKDANKADGLDSLSDDELLDALA